MGTDLARDLAGGLDADRPAHATAFDHSASVCRIFRKC